MQVNLKMLQGRFERGYALDKHSLYSLPTGYNAAGHIQWHTQRTEVGEALYQLKYRQQQRYVLPLALLSKAKGAALLKDLRTRAEKDAVLTDTLILNRLIHGEGRWDTLLLDDLYDSGASVDAACDALRAYEKIGDIFVATLTWR